MTKKAQNEGNSQVRALSHTLFCSMMVFLPFSCNRTPPHGNKNDPLGVSLEPKLVHTVPLLALPECKKPGLKGAPLLFGDFLHQTIGTPKVEDILQSPRNRATCAPGPFKLDRQTFIDGSDTWNLTEVPNFFVWQTHGATGEHHFFLANKYGFPLRSQALKVEEKHGSTLILVPKDPLKPGLTYYLYLKEQGPTQRETWIQPIKAS